MSGARDAGVNKYKRKIGIIAQKRKIVKILLVRNDNIGDLICTTPAIEALRKTHPRAQIDIVVNSLNACVVRGNPFLNKIYIYTKPKHVKGLAAKVRAFWGKCKILLQIRREKYDATVIFRSAYSPSAAIFARAAGAKMTIGAAKQNEGGSLITHKLNFNPPPHEVLLCCELVAPLGAKFDGEKTLYVPSFKSEKFKDFVFFHVSSRVEQNRMDEAKILRILAFLKQNFGCVAVSAEDKFGEKVAQEAGVEFAATKNLDELAGYIWAAKFVLTLDGGVAHLAPALGVKTVLVLGKTDAARWAPVYGGAPCAVLQSASKRAQDVADEEIYEAVKNI